MLVLYIVLFICFVILSAFFSSSETAILSLNKIKLNLRVKKGEKKAILIKKLLNKPHHFFSTILMGNNLVNIAAATVATAFFSEIIISSREWRLIVSTVFTTVIILIFSEIIPKTLAMHYNEKLSQLYVGPLKLVYFIFYPFVILLSFFAEGLTSTSKGKGMALNPREIKYFLTSELSLFKYNPEVIEMLSQIIDITQKDIKNFMIPRVNIVGIKESINKKDLIKLLEQEKNVKYPLYKDNFDSITGVLRGEDILLNLIKNEIDHLDLKAIASEPLFLSEYSSLDYTLKMFKDKKSTMAFIIDEYGVTIGLITLSDILNEIAGFIKFDKEPIIGITKNIHIVLGEVPVFIINEKLDISLPASKDYTTVSGLFTFYYGKLPRPGSQIRLDDTIITVKNVKDKRIKNLKIEKLQTKITQGR